MDPNVVQVTKVLARSEVAEISAFAFGVRVDKIQVLSSLDLIDTIRNL